MSGYSKIEKLYSTDWRELGQHVRRPEHRLWMAVLQRALTDALTLGCSHQKEAIDWLRSPEDTGVRLILEMLFDDVDGAQTKMLDRLGLGVIDRIEVRRSMRCGYGPSKK